MSFLYASESFDMRLAYCVSCQVSQPCEKNFLFTKCMLRLWSITSVNSLDVLVFVGDFRPGDACLLHLPLR